MTTRISLVTLGCARNDVDSQELAARFEAAGMELVDEPELADAVVVNTCGFVEAAKKDSVDTLLAAADLKPDVDHADTPETTGPSAVIAVGCLAERYGGELASSLPEADAVLGFDDYPDIAAKVRAVLDGDRPAPPVPRDRRLLLPLAPTSRREGSVSTPGHDLLPEGLAPASGPRAVRRRLDGRPVAPLKIASGCDRRCSFCAIPSFRGAFLSRQPLDIIDEAKWLADQGVSELYLVSENSTSYGKDLGDLRLLEQLLPQLSELEGIERVRVSYLQPAETRPGLIDVMTSTPKVADYFDLSFQHASGPLLRRMRRFGDTERFSDLIEMVRSRAPHAGIRSNVIVGFPGETGADRAELERFLVQARLDVVGVFGYSNEDGTEAEQFDDQLTPDEVAEHVEYFVRLVEELTAQRAEDRIGSDVRVLVEESSRDGTVGRAEHQGPDVDGTTRLEGVDLPVGTWVDARVVASEGVDLVAAVGA
ncbi:MAG: radical SAM protein [Candidatus Nanopelagicales bacterium]